MRKFTEEEIDRYAELYVNRDHEAAGSLDMYQSMEKLGEEKSKALVKDFLLFVLIEEECK